ncbi:MAG TPA: hypothetical protein VFZ64_00910 [Nocardioidaceae bacterium]
MAGDDETPWYRPLIVGLGAMLGVAVLVGGLIGLVALGAANVAGLGDDRPTTQEEPTLYIPERTASETPGAEDDGLTLEDLNGGVDPTETRAADEESEQSKKKAKKKKRKPESVISLSASPLEVAQMERIYLSGTYPRGEGASLQVQRMQGSWTDFPTSTSVSGGTFSTYVMTGQSGTNKFRVVDASTGKKSNPVTVQVR